MLVLSFSLGFLFRNILQLISFEKFGLEEHLAVVVLSLFPFSVLRCAGSIVGTFNPSRDNLGC